MRSTFIRKRLWLLFLGIVAASVSVQGQVELQLNGNVEFELSKGGEDSHFYYNGIHKDHEDWRFGPSQANLLAGIKFSDQWSVNTRLILQRELGDAFDQFLLGQLNLQWTAKEKPLQVTVGRFISPFGSFNNRQFPTDRTFIDLPLAYGYYTDLSARLGFMGNSKWTNLLVDQIWDWGTTTHYWGGYTDGIKLGWDIVPNKTLLEVAVVNGAALNTAPFEDPFRWGVVGRLGIRPNYFWEQGFSLSHGSFMQRHPINQQLTALGDFRQTLLGTDYKFGFGYFEVSGEIMVALFKAPLASRDEDVAVGVNGEESASTFSGYLNFRYEPPILPGSYLAYRIDTIRFSEMNGESWDDSVVRHSFGLGYKITTYLLFRANYSWQNVNSKDWNQTAFRSGLTLHF